MTRPGSTLLEVLAASALLALLAAAVVPAVRASGAAAARERERLEAEVWLRSGGTVVAGESAAGAVPAHPQWRLVVEDLPQRVRQDRAAAIPRTWRRLSVRDAAGELASTLVLTEAAP